MLPPILSASQGIVGHDYFIDKDNLSELRQFDFVFVCVDRGSVRKQIVDSLREWGQRFIDVGIGVESVSDKLRGQIRVTASTPEMADHLDYRIPTEDPSVENEYATNIQVADLNSLNASLAVIKWKKIFGFYLDQDGEHHCVYTIDGNMLANSDHDDR